MSGSCNGSWPPDVDEIRRLLCHFKRVSERSGPKQVRDAIKRVEASTHSDGYPSSDDLAVLAVWLMTLMKPKRVAKKKSDELVWSKEETKRSEPDDEQVRSAQRRFGVSRSQIYTKRGKIVLRGD